MNFLKYINLFIVQFFLCIVCFAQRERIDSLKNVLSKLKDTARIDCLLELSFQYCELEYNEHQLNQPYRDTALLYDNLAYGESKKIGYIHGIAQSFLLKADLRFFFLRDYDGAEKLIIESLKWYEQTGNKRRIEFAYSIMGSALFKQYRFEESFTNIEKSYYWAEKNENIEEMLGALGFKYESYRDMGEYDKAFDVFQKTLQLQGKFKSDDASFYIFYEPYVLAELQRRMGNYSIALNYYRKVVAGMDLNHSNIWFRTSYPELFALNGQFDSAQYYYNQIDSSKCNKHDLRFYLVSLGEFYLLKKEYNKAIGYLLRGLQYHREAKDINYVKRALIDVAKTCAALDRNYEAIIYAREGLTLSLQARAKQYVRDAYQILYEIYQKQNKTDSAFIYYQKYVMEKEMVENDVVKGKFAAYDYEQQIRILDKEKQLQQQELKQTAQQKKFLMVSIIAVTLMGLVIFRIVMLKRRNEKQKLEHDLQLQKLESEKTESELKQQATELEMQALRVQMNPHFIFNCLNSINRFILTNEPTKAADHLTKFAKLIRIVLQQSGRSFIPLEDELHSLQLYMDLEALRFEIPFSYEIKQDGIDTSAVMVPPLLLQPFVENAIWHGLHPKENKNGKISIDLKQHNEILRCSICDNGIGRNKSKSLAEDNSIGKKSLGIKLTQHRLELFESSLKQDETVIVINDLINETGQSTGTCVHIKIPVKSV